MLAALKSFPPELPEKWGYSLGKLDRAVSKLAGTIKKSNSYENLAPVTTMSAQIAAVRELIKSTQSFFSGKTGVNKKFEEGFYVSFKKVQAEHPELIVACSPMLQQRYIEVGYNRDLASHDWAAVAQHTSLQKQVEVHDGDVEAGEKGCVILAEKLMAYLLEELPKHKDAGGDEDLVLDFVKARFLEAVQEALGGRPAESVAVPLAQLELLVQLKPDAGKDTMDSILDFLDSNLSKPMVRVFVNSVMGKRLKSKANEANSGMQARASIAISLTMSAADIKSLKSNEEYTSFVATARTLNDSTFMETLQETCQMVVTLINPQAESLLQQSQTLEVLRDSYLSRRRNTVQIKVL